MSTTVSKTCKPTLPHRDDINALRALLQSVDKSRIKHALQTVGCLTSPEDEDSPTAMLIKIVCKDRTFTCFSELYHRFLDGGFIDIAVQFLRCYEIKPGTVSVVCRSPQGVRMRALDNIYRWQGMLHDGLFTDPFAFFRVLFETMKLKGSNESNEKRKVYYADNCEYVQILELDTTMTIYDPSRFDEKLFQRVHSLSSQTSSATTFDALCCSRRALALAFAGNFAAAENMANYAKFLVQFGSATVEYANVMYFSICCKLCQYQHSPTEELKESLLDEGKQVLSMLLLDEDPSNEKNVVTRRVILLRMASCLLGIGFKGNVFPDFQVSEADLQRAESLLSAIELSGAVDRRKMFLFIIRARVHELRGNLWQALTTISQAYFIAQKDHFTEAGVVDSYLYSLLESLNQSMLKNLNQSQFERLNRSLLQSLNKTLLESLNQSLLESLNPSLLRNADTSTRR
jgi:hypothetical protein